jgi:hypothetical protein
MLPHQLMDCKDFISQCGYCSKPFVNVNDPTFTRISAKEYLVFSCENGHEHSINVDVTNPQHRKWIEEDILEEHIPLKRKKKVDINIENKIRGRWLDLMDQK